MTRLPQAAWWTVRRAQNRKPVTYRCPLCGGRLPAFSEHLLIAPEGDLAHRRHAHTRCVLRARERGELPLERESPRGKATSVGWWRRLVARLPGVR